jgi:peptidyl-prolyl cis-trans isomerase B (cyclophilin B)
MLMTLVMIAFVALQAARPAPQRARPAPARPPQTAPEAPAFFTTPFAPEEMRGKQAVIETTAGTIVVALLPEAAPNHVGFFMTQARAGAYAGTIFHTVVRGAIVQGGDPISRDRAREADYGQGGFNRLRAEPNGQKHVAGAVSAVRIQGQPDSAGMQFFICASDQPTLDGQYDVFGQVVEGLEVVQRISAAEAGPDGRPRSRIAITAVTIRDTPEVPFLKDTAATLASYRAEVETTMGRLVLEFLPDRAPETVRAFLRRAAAGVYDGILVHRVAPDFVVQTGALNFRDAPLTAAQQQLVFDLQPEFSDTPLEHGVVAMARGDDPASASTSFFICTGQCRALDGKYTVFARVTGGLDVLNAIATVPVDGETPRTPIRVVKIAVVGPGR